ncbi:peptidase [Desulforamulus ferrireducens]|uniref:Peptidase n=1 Tax=Desulforamulus ferrireducens TaxID=1833852 RepID=A0A1S6IUF6_9FIRM|nr:peptidase [Desulforamulus ferrireducens]AQS58364.1 peptidase [Desulforamulus ferrireducens]
MLNRTKTSADVELIIDLYEREKASLTAMIVNIREILLLHQDDAQATVEKIKAYLKEQGVEV